MMVELRVEWYALFLKTVINLKVVSFMTVRVTGAYEIYPNGIKTFSVSKVIIDNMLTWSTNLNLVLIYFE